MRTVIPIALFVLFAPAALAADPATLVDRWAAAVGGQERIKAIHAIHLTGERFDDGTAGTFDEWITERLERREIIDHVKDQSLTVFNGTEGWLHDWNGKTQNLEGEDRRLQVDLAILHGFGAMVGQAGAPEPSGGEAGSNGVRFQPPGGIPITYVLDPATGLPASAELAAHWRPIKITFSDWRDVAGVKIPFSETRTDSISRIEFHIKSVSFEETPNVAFTRPADGPSDASFLHGSKSVTIPSNFDNQHVIISGSVNGVGPTWFLIDTGANASFLNQPRMEEFQLQPYGGLKTEGGANSTAGAYAEGVTWRFGEVELRNQHAGVLSLNGLERVFGMPLGGLLGYDFLSRFVVDFDYAKQTVTLRPPSDCRDCEKGMAIPFALVGQQPYIDGSIRVGDQTIPASFILDVGPADTMTFATPFVSAHNLAELAGERGKAPRRLAGSEKEFFGATTIRGLIDEIRFGSVAFQHVPVNLSLGTSGAYSTSGFSGNIGQALLSRFPHVVLDYAHNRMIVFPGPSTDKPFEERRSFGLTLLADAKDLHLFRVTAVGKDSPAERAGFVKDDVIAAVDDRLARSISMAQLREILAANGTKHRFTVEREAQPVSFTVEIETVPISTIR